MQYRDKSLWHHLPLLSREMVSANDTIQCFNPEKLLQFLDTRSASNLVFTTSAEWHSLSLNSRDSSLDDTLRYWYTSIVVEIVKLKFVCSDPDTHPFFWGGKLQGHTIKVNRTRCQKIIGNEDTKAQTVDLVPVLPYIEQLQEEAREEANEVDWGAIEHGQQLQGELTMLWAQLGSGKA